jgi:hypothetical protein
VGLVLLLVAIPLKNGEHNFKQKLQLKSKIQPFPHIVTVNVFNADLSQHIYAYR